MKKKEITTLVTTDVEDLRKEVSAMKRTIATTLVSRLSKPAKNVREIKKMRNRVAIMLTAIRQKELQHG
jgi:ribosomal protein L29